MFEKCVSDKNITYSCTIYLWPNIQSSLGAKEWDNKLTSLHNYNE